MSDLQKLTLYGCGGMGREIARMVDRINEVQPTYDLIGFIDDDKEKWGQILNDVPVLGGIEWLIKNKDSVVCCCTVGFTKLRKTLCEKLICNEIQQVTLIDPTAEIDKTSTVGIGTVIQSKCEISVNSTVGNGVFMNGGVELGHDVTVGDYCVFNPKAQISGGCQIGNEVSLGGMCFLNPKARVGDKAVVAPLSAVYGKVKPETHVLGNPAHRIEL